MNCKCPKCAFTIEIDRSRITDKGTDTICPECGTRFWVYRESFGARALKRDGSVCCASCGRELNASIACPSCGEIYPNLHVTQRSKPVRKRQTKVRTTYVISLKTSRKPRHKKPAVLQKASEKKRDIKGFVVGLTVLTFVAVAGTLIYLHKNAEKTYAMNYVRALHGLKSGTYAGLDACKKILSNSKRGESLGVTISSQDEKRINRIKNEVDKLIQTTSQPPSKYVDANKKLAKLYEIYSDVYTLTNKTDHSLKSLSDKTAELESKFEAGMRDLEHSLPKDLAADLENARVKYKSLRKS